MATRRVPAIQVGDQVLNKQHAKLCDIEGKLGVVAAIEEGRHTIYWPDGTETIEHKDSISYIPTQAEVDRVATELRRIRTPQAWANIGGRRAAPVYIRDYSLEDIFGGEHRSGYSARALQCMRDRDDGDRVR